MIFNYKSAQNDSDTPANHQAESMKSIYRTKRIRYLFVLAGKLNLNMSASSSSSSLPTSSSASGTNPSSKTSTVKAVTVWTVCGRFVTHFDLKHATAKDVLTTAAEGLFFVFDLFRLVSQS